MYKLYCVVVLFLFLKFLLSLGIPVAQTLWDSTAGRRAESWLMSDEHCCEECGEKGFRSLALQASGGFFGETTFALFVIL